MIKNFKEIEYLENRAPLRIQTRKQKRARKIKLIKFIFILSLIVAGYIFISNKIKEFNSPVYIEDRYIDCVNLGECEDLTETKEAPISDIQDIKKEDKCDHITIFWKDKKEVSINCEDLKTVVRHFGKDEKLIAIILHESAFNRKAINKNKDGSLDRGIFQLNSNFFSMKAGDLDYSAEQAKKCLKENGYNCWTAYKNGEYKQHIENAKYLLSKI